MSIRAEFPKESVIRVAAILLILYVQTSSAQSAVQTAEQILSTVIPNWVPTIGAAFLIGYGLAGLGFMLASVFRIPEFSAWAKLELAEVTSTAFMIAIILFAVVASDNIFKAATISPEYPYGQTPLEVSSAFTSQITEELLSIYFRSVSLNLAVGTLSGVPLQITHQEEKGGGGAIDTIPLNKLYQNLEKNKAGTGKVASTGGLLFAILFSSAWLQINTISFYGLSVFQTHIASIQASMITAITLTVLIDIFGLFIKEAVLPVMVPLGVVLRTFSFTRKLGATLIALAIGAYFFFPAGVLISKIMYDSAYKIDTPSLPKINSPSLNIAGIPSNPERFTDIAGPLLNPPDLSFKACVKELGGGFLGTLACAIGYFFWFILKINIWIIEVIKALIQLILFVSVNIFGGILAFVCPPCAFIQGYYLNVAVIKSVAMATLSFIPYILQFSVPIFLTPLIVIIVLVTGIRSISPVIGGEARILGVSQLI